MWGSKSDQFQIIFLGAWLIALFCLRKRGTSSYSSAWKMVARHQGCAIALVGFISLLTYASLSLLIEIPLPEIHDEYSYLLAGDTFAHGRLANPTHPMWQHFESPQIIHQPTYASKYQPGQGMFLALGQVLTGRPIAGIWFSGALAAAALCWMLMGWVPPRWAFLGGLLAAFHPVLVGWSQNYWGGGVATIGGALMLGAFQRLLRHSFGRGSRKNAYALGIGMSVLAISRPYEGFVLGLILMIPLLVVMLRRGHYLRGIFQHLLLPILLILMLTAAGLAYYNKQVTGSVWVMPYAVHEATYAVAPIFIWQSVKPEPGYRHKQIRDLQVDWALTVTRPSRYSLIDFAVTGLRKIRSLSSMYFAVLLAIPLLAAPFVLFVDRKARHALVMAGLFIFGVLLECYPIATHYVAPAIGLLFFLALQCLRRLSVMKWRGLAVGNAIAPALLMCTFILPVLSYLEMRRHVSLRDVWIYQKAGIRQRLERTNERHVVLVRYGSAHNTHFEWVYNGADIDGSRVIWAREMDPASNDQLLEYYSDRRAWLLKVDDGEVGNVELVPIQSSRPSLRGSVEPPGPQ